MGLLALDRAIRLCPDVPGPFLPDDRDAAWRGREDVRALLRGFLRDQPRRDVGYAWATGENTLK